MCECVVIHVSLMHSSLIRETQLPDELIRIVMEYARGMLFCCSQCGLSQNVTTRDIKRHVARESDLAKQRNYKILTDEQGRKSLSLRARRFSGYLRIFDEDEYLFLCETCIAALQESDGIWSSEHQCSVCQGPLIGVTAQQTKREHRAHTDCALVLYDSSTRGASHATVRSDMHL